MKKLFAIVLALVLALSAIPALAATELNWSDVEAAVANVDARFVLIEEVSAIMWVPAELQQIELDKEYLDAGYIGVFTTEDGSYIVGIQYMDVGGAALSDFVAAMTEVGGAEFEEGIVNGIPCLTFSLPEADAGCVAIATENGYFLVFTFAPISDEEFATVAGFMIASIQPME